MQRYKIEAASFLKKVNKSNKKYRHISQIEFDLTKKSDTIKYKICLPLIIKNHEQYGLYTYQPDKDIIFVRSINERYFDLEFIERILNVSLMDNISNTVGNLEEEKIKYNSFKDNYVHTE